MDRSGEARIRRQTLTSGGIRRHVRSSRGHQDQHVAIDLRSSAFDTYLIFKDPAGEQTENDDSDDGGDTGHSSIEADLTEAGTYQVMVTSYEADGGHAYSLTIDPIAAPRRRARRPRATFAP